MDGTTSMEEIAKVLEATKFRLVQQVRMFTHSAPRFVSFFCPKAWRTWSFIDTPHYMRLQIGKEKKLHREIEAEIRASESNVESRRIRMGEYNALFMTLENAEKKAPRQKLGARDAVAGTRRIVEINLHKLEKEIATQELKLNRARDHNLKLKDRIDLLRKEHITYKKLFASLGTNLEQTKEKIKSEYPG